MIMDMPTPCPRCGEVVELDDMVSHPNEFKTLVCEECHDKIEEENNRGFEPDSFGNVVEWRADPDDGLINFSVNSVEVADWSYKDDPEVALRHFMTIWHKAQSLTNNAYLRELTAEREQLSSRVSELEEIICALDKNKYLGFTISQMLYHLSKSCKKVRLEAKGEADWLLYVLSDQHGEFEMQGSMMLTLGQASKPFFIDWQLERNAAKERMDSLLASVRAKDGE